MDVAPVLVIGGGPVGLAAGAALLERGITPLILEAAPAASAHVAQWAHVPLFTPWRMNVSPSAARLLDARGWRRPPDDECPTADALVRDYLAPLSRDTRLAGTLRTGHAVTAIARSRTGDGPRPFRALVASGGSTGTLHAWHVIDATGTYAFPGPLGADGAPAEGEAQAGASVRYRIPSEASIDAGDMPAIVAGGGDSALNAIDRLARHGRVIWLLRRHALPRADSKYPAKERLARAVMALVDQGVVQVRFGFHADRISVAGECVSITGGTEQVSGRRAYVLTGFRPDLALTRELRLSLDREIECPAAMTPALGGCGSRCDTTRTHLVAAGIAHPDEPGFYTIGAKSFGRASDFFLDLGHAQAEAAAALVAERIRRVNPVEALRTES